MPRRPTLIQLLVLIGLLNLAACSVVEFAYNNVALYVEGEVDSALDLSSSQQALLSTELERLLKWHRAQELPAYAETFRSAADRLDDGLQASDVLLFVDDVQVAARRFAGEGIDRAAPLLADLSEKQLQNYDAAFQERIEDDLELSGMTPGDRRRALAEKHVGRFEEWFGEFEVEQYDKAMVILKRLPDFHDQWVRFRQVRHKAFLELLASKPGADAIRQRLRAWFVERRDLYTPAFERDRQAFWQAYAASAEQIDALMTDSQRQRAARRLRSYAESFDSLHRQGG